MTARVRHSFVVIQLLSISNFERSIVQKLYNFQNKKPLSLTSKAMAVFVGGVGESRTPVQTGNQKAFYTLICRLGFRCCAWPTAATQHLASKIFEPAPKLHQPYSHFTVPLNWTPQDKASKENPAFLPCRSEAHLTMIQIKQQERSYFRRLKCCRI